jgi:hypothetical protein
MLLIDRLLIKSDMKSEMARKAKPNKLNFARYAYRPRLVSNNNVDTNFNPSLRNENNINNNLESVDSYASLYQIYDRSAQTSMELIDPLVEHVIRKKKILETSSLIDEKDMTNNNKNSQLDDRTRSLNNVTIGALSNFLIFPLMATPNNNLNSSSVSQFDESNNTSTSTRTRINSITSKPSILLKSFKSNSKESFPELKSMIADERKKTEDAKNAAATGSSESSTTKTPHFSLTSNSTTSTTQSSLRRSSNSSLRKKLGKSFKMRSFFEPDLNENDENDDEDSALSLSSSKKSNRRFSVKNFSSNHVKEYKKSVLKLESTNNQKDNKTIEKDLQIVNVLDEDRKQSSLEDFKKVLNQNENFFVKVDAVKASDYL